MDNLSASTTTACAFNEVANFISSRACIFVGSETATVRRFPRLKIGNAVCFFIKSGLTSFTTSRSMSTKSMETIDMPNSLAEAEAIVELDTNLFSITRFMNGVFFSCDSL